MDTDMGSMGDFESSSTPTLSLFSLPYKSPEPPGMLTPPLRTAASIPFEWEEAPGKPRVCTNMLSKPSAGRCLALELPPRLFSEVKSTHTSSPTTVLDGPYVGRSASCSSSSFCSRERQRSFSSPEEEAERGQLGALLWSRSKRERKERGWHLGSWGRRGSLKGSRKCVVGGGDGGFVCSSVVGGDDGEANGGADNTTRVKITRFRRSGSFFGPSHTKSHLWASLYSSLKQVVPWSGSRKLKKAELVM